MVAERLARSYKSATKRRFTAALTRPGWARTVAERAARLAGGGVPAGVGRDGPVVDGDVEAPDGLQAPRHVHLLGAELGVIVCPRVRAVDVEADGDRGHHRRAGRRRGLQVADVGARDAECGREDLREDLLEQAYSTRSLIMVWGLYGGIREGKLWAREAPAQGSPA
jgi:hypothetical protein